MLSDLKKMKVKGWKEKMRTREQRRPRLTQDCSAEWKEGMSARTTPSLQLTLTENLKLICSEVNCLQNLSLSAAVFRNELYLYEKSK
jgi:hypothetical protein